MYVPVHGHMNESITEMVHTKKKKNGGEAPPCGDRLYYNLNCYICHRAVKLQTSTDRSQMAGARFVHI